MIIVNDEKNLPATFAVFSLKKFKGYLTEAFLTNMLAPGYKLGVARNNTWVIKTDGVVRFDKDTVETRIITKLIEWNFHKGFTYFMFTR